MNNPERPVRSPFRADLPLVALNAEECERVRAAAPCGRIAPSAAAGWAAIDGAIARRAEGPVPSTPEWSGVVPRFLPTAACCLVLALAAFALGVGVGLALAISSGG